MVNFSEREIAAVFRLDGRMYGFDKRALVRASSAQQQRIFGRKAGRKPFRVLKKNVLSVIDSFEQLDFHAIERLYWLEPISVGMPDECIGAVQVAFALRLWGNALKRFCDPQKQLD